MKSTPCEPHPPDPWPTVESPSPLRHSEGETTAEPAASARQRWKEGRLMSNGTATGCHQMLRESASCDANGQSNAKSSAKWRKRRWLIMVSELLVLEMARILQYKWALRDGGSSKVCRKMTAIRIWGTWAALNLKRDSGGLESMRRTAYIYGTAREWKDSERARACMCMQPPHRGPSDSDEGLGGGGGGREGEGRRPNSLLVLLSLAAPFQCVDVPFSQPEAWGLN